jgi:hypothetical protein
MFPSRGRLFSCLITVSLFTSSLSGSWTAIGPAPADITYLSAASGIFAHVKTFNADLGLERLKGELWVPVPLGFSLYYGEVTQLVADPSDASTIYFGLKGGCPGACLQKSTDGGATWAAADRGIDCQVNDALVADPVRPGTLYAAGTSFTPGGHRYCEGVFRTTDRGATWTRIETGLRSVNDGYDAFFLSNFGPMTISPYGKLYVVSNSRDGVVGFFSSVDGGASWMPRAAPAALPAYAVEADPHVAGKLWLLTGSGLYRSVDDALSWQLASPAPSFPKKLADPRYPNFRGAFVINPGPLSMAFTTDGTDVFQTRDGGETWTNIRDGLPDMSILSMTIDRAGALYVGTAGGGVYVWDVPRRQAVRH